MEVDQQTIALDSKIKVINNRCENELKPRLKAVSLHHLLTPVSLVGER